VVGGMRGKEMNWRRELGFGMGRRRVGLFEWLRMREKEKEGNDKVVEVGLGRELVLEEMAEMEGWIRLMWKWCR